MGSLAEMNEPQNRIPAQPIESPAQKANCTVASLSGLWGICNVLKLLLIG